MFQWKPDRPFAVFDIEATGTNTKTDRLIDLCVIRIATDGARSTHKFRVNPGIPIPPATTAIHGIRDEDVADCPTFDRVVDRVSEAFDDCDLGGYNCLRYDIPLLQAEFLRANRMFSLEGRRVIDAQRIFHLREPRDLTAALLFYCGKDHVDAHGAEADTLATVSVLEGEFLRYRDLPADVDELNRLCAIGDGDSADRMGRLKWVNGEVVLNFGKKSGQSLRSLAATDPGFLKWMLRSDFAPDTLDFVRNALDGRFPERTAATPRGGRLGEVV